MVVRAGEMLKKKKGEEDSIVWRASAGGERERLGSRGVTLGRDIAITLALCGHLRTRIIYAVVLHIYIYTASAVYVIHKSYTLGEARPLRAKCRKERCISRAHDHFRVSYEGDFT